MDLQQTLESIGYETLSYSGRGMMGRTCLAVTVNSLNEMWDVAIGLGQTQNEDFYAVPAPQHDNMGRDYVLYWPRIPYKVE